MTRLERAMEAQNERVRAVLGEMVEEGAVTLDDPATQSEVAALIFSGLDLDLDDEWHAYRLSTRSLL